MTVDDDGKMCERLHIQGEQRALSYLDLRPPEHHRGSSQRASDLRMHLPCRHTREDLGTQCLQLETY